MEIVLLSSTSNKNIIKNKKNTQIKLKTFIEMKTNKAFLYSLSFVLSKIVNRVESTINGSMSRQQLQFSGHKNKQSSTKIIRFHWGQKHLHVILCKQSNSIAKHTLRTPFWITFIKKKLISTRYRADEVARLSSTLWHGSFFYCQSWLLSAAILNYIETLFSLTISNSFFTYNQVLLFLQINSSFTTMESWKIPQQWHILMKQFHNWVSVYWVECFIHGIL